MKTILFLVGVEGTGHHLFLSACNYQEGAQAHGLFLDAFDTFSTPQKINEKREKLKLFLRHQPCDFRHIERASFPYGRPFNSLLRYDILEFKQVLESIPDLKFGFIVITRNLVDSTLSSWSRMDERSISTSPGTNTLKGGISLYEAAKAQESNTLYIQSQVRLIDKSKMIILSYEDMIIHPENITPKVRDVLGIDDFWLDPSKVCVPAPRKKSQNRDFLESFFCSQRLSQFQYLTQNKTDLSASSGLTIF